MWLAGGTEAHCIYAKHSGNKCLRADKVTLSNFWKILLKKKKNVEK